MAKTTKTDRDEMLMQMQREAFSQTIKAFRKASERAQLGLLDEEGNPTGDTSKGELAEFIYLASHDFFAPFRRIAAFTELLHKNEHDNLSPKGQSLLRIVHENVMYMEELLEGMLEYSRVLTWSTKMDKVELREVVDAVVNELAESLALAGGDVLVLDLPEAVITSDDHLRLLLRQILSNSIKFRSTERKLTIEIKGVKTNRGFLELTVKDNGIGISEGEIDKLFKPFQKLHNRKEYGGSGIGLAIVERIVKLHGGTVTINNRPEGGCIVQIRLKVKTS